MKKSILLLLCLVASLSTWADPEAAPTAPSKDASQVKAVYSSTYNADCNFGEWGGGTTYTQETYGKKFVNGSLGYFGLEFTGLDCHYMEYLHLDVYADEAGSMRIVPIHGGTEVGITKDYVAGWNSFDIPLSDYQGVTNWSNVYQIKIDNVANKTFWLNNVYFYTTVDYFSGTVTASSNNSTAYLSCDGNTGTRWASANADGDKIFWQRNYDEAQTFNRVKIIWEGAYGKSFKIQKFNSKDEGWTDIATVTGQTLSGFPYTQIIELENDVTAKYIRFQGVEKATGYGYSFWEFEVYEAETSVLTSLDFSAAAAICKVGNTVTLTATPKDQYGATMSGTVSYSVSPANAGHVIDGVYTADASGSATVTATCGSLSKQVSILNYTGDNVALNKTVTAEGYNEAARLVDGNDGTEWQGDPSNGTSELNVTTSFVVDLGAQYDLNLVTIHFEGACSDAYTLETSADNEAWSTSHTFAGTLGINNHTDYLYGDDLANNTNVRYIRFTSTKNSTQWGMKILEFQAFGAESASKDPVESVSLDQTTASVEVDHTITLTKTVLPSTADQHVTWSVNEEGKNIVSVDNGVVTGLAIGTAVVTATSTTDANKSASCTVTVTALTPKTFYGVITGTKEDVPGVEGTANYTIYYAITRNADYTLSCSVSTDGNFWNATGLANGSVSYVGSTDWADFEKNNDGTRTRRTSKDTYKDKEGQDIECFFHFAYSGGLLQPYFHYTVGAENASTTTSISAVGYSTYYTSQYAYTMPAGVTGYIFNATENKIASTYAAGSVVPAGEALVLKGAQGDYTLNYTLTANSVNANNALLGTDAETALTADANYYFYGLSLNAANETNSVGFYWMAADGAAFTNGAHKAYLKLAKPANNEDAKSAFLFEDEEATAIKDLTPALSEGEGVVYNLAGQRVAPTTKGILIQNGKKFINK